MSIKSTTIKPPISLSLSCTANESAASKFVLRAVSSISPPFVDLAELTSMLVKASVVSKTIFPPDGRVTFFLYTLCTCASTPKLLNNGTDLV